MNPKFNCKMLSFRSNSNSAMKGMTWFIFLILGLYIGYVESACPYPSDIKNGNLEPENSKQNKNGGFSNNARVRIECHNGYKLRNPHYDVIQCSKGKWISTEGEKSSQIDQSTMCVPDRCKEPPRIDHGFYQPETQDAHFPSTSYPVGTFLQAFCEKYFLLNCTKSKNCGRIRCNEDGIWSSATKGDELVSTCHSFSLPVVGSQNGSPNRSESSSTNYLVPVLTIICILVISTIAIFILRKCQLLCRKRYCQQADTNNVGGSTQQQQFHALQMPMRSGGGGGGGGCPDLDAFNVANNTGMFLPGVNYDLQDCNFQASPIVGTSVFK